MNGIQIFSKGIRFCQSTQRKRCGIDAVGSKESSLSDSTEDKAFKIIPGVDSKEKVHQPSGLNDDEKNIQEK